MIIPKHIEVNGKPLCQSHDALPLSILQGTLAWMFCGASDLETLEAARDLLKEHGVDATIVDGHCPTMIEEAPVRPFDATEQGV